MGDTRKFFHSCNCIFTYAYCIFFSITYVQYVHFILEGAVWLPIGWVTGRTWGLQKTCATYPPKLLFQKSGGRNQGRARFTWKMAVKTALMMMMMW